MQDWHYKAISRSRDRRVRAGGGIDGMVTGEAEQKVCQDRMDGNLVGRTE